jgi:hypothetical protein
MPIPPNSATPFCVGPWLESDAVAFADWLATHASVEDQVLHPAVAALRAALAANPVMDQLARAMVDQVPHAPPYDRAPYGAPLVRALDAALRGQQPSVDATAIPINAHLARVRRARPSTSKDIL